MYQYASIPGFIRTLLIILLIYYGIKVLTRLFAPYLMRYVSKKAGQRFEQQFGQYQRPPETTSKEGDVTIDSTPEKTKSSKDDVGEYVDFEEVD
ncbi:MAG: DUF4834 family protein [Flavobacteriaceae bacterium]|nr:DUF4834 family protein [Bacteroidia bacterium]NND09889.1 DUF4834 family protein [Flavobacteriaceae bacterium]NNK27062.1 DUF4834 family protein [Flavobacteriaceae bacterium]NNL61309.1 DUF4834 family protein [Flavobacteriaceae bacterium]RZV65678.1 MAG: DUF4834 family protein [Flavobacteriaceae bacterium]